jgi:hypothetical protein
MDIPSSDEFFLKSMKLEEEKMFHCRHEQPCGTYEDETENEYMCKSCTKYQLLIDKVRTYWKTYHPSEFQGK